MALRLTANQNYGDISGNLTKIQAALGLNIHRTVSSDDGVSNVSYVQLGLRSTETYLGSGTYNNPFLVFQRETTNPANNDALRHVFRAQNSAHEDTTIALWNYSMPDVTDGAETGKIQLRMKLAAYAATRALLEAEGDNFRMLDDRKLTFGDNDEAQFEYDEDGTNHVRYDGVDMVFDTATKLMFNDAGMFIYSSGSGHLNLNTSQDVIMTADQEAQTGVQDGLIYTVDCSHASGPANDIGAGLIIKIDDAGGVEEQARVNFVLTDVTDSAEDCDIIFRQNIAGTMTTRLTLDADGAIIFVGPMSISVDNAVNNGVTDLMTLEHTTSGAPAAGIGTGLVFNVEDAGGSEEQGSIDVVLTNVTNGAENADIAFKTNVAGTIIEKLLLNADGLSKLVGSLEVENGATFGTTALVVDNDDVDQIAVLVEAANTTANIVDLQSTALTSGKAIDISDLAAIVDGKAIHVDATGVTHTTGVLVHIDSGSNVITGAGRLFLSDHTNTAGVSATLNEFKTIAADETILLQLTADALTSGDAENITVDGIVDGRGLAITSTSLVQTTASLLAINGVAQGSGLANRTGNFTTISSSRREDGATAVSDDYDVLNIVRTSRSNNAGATLAEAGSVLQLQNIAIQTSGTLTDTVDVLEIIQDADSTGQSIDIDHNGAANAITLVSGSDAATSSLQITNEAGGFGVNVSRNLAAAATDSALVYINDDGASDQYALHVHTDAVSDAGGRAIYIDADSMTTLTAIELTMDALTQGIAELLATTSVDITSGEIWQVSRNSSGTLAAKTGNLTSIRDSHGHTADTDITLNYDTLDIVRSHTRNTGGADTHATTNQGSVLRVENSVIPTTGTVTDTVDVLQLIQDADAGGNSLDIDHNPNSIAVNIDAENTTTDVINLSAAVLTTGNAFDIPDLDLLTTGKGLNIASGSEAIAAGELATFALTSSGSTITAKTGSLVSIASSRTELAAAATADNYDVLSVTRTNITNTLGTLTADGSVARFENVATQTAGTLTDNVDVLELVQDAQSTGQSITIDHNPDSIAIFIDAENVTTNLLDISAQVLTTGKILDISDLDAFTTGKILHIDATGVTQTDGMLIHLDSASTALTATGRLFLSDHTGNATVSGVLNEFKSAAADETIIAQFLASAALAAGKVINISAAALTTGECLDISDLAAITTGNVIHVDATGVTQTDGKLVYLDSASTALTANGRLLLSDHTGNATVSGILNEFKSAATDETIIVQILASAALAAGKALNISAASMTTGDGISMADLNALTTGRGLHIASSATAITGAGRLLYVNHTGVTSTSGTLAEIASAATDETDVLKINGTGQGTGRSLIVTGGVNINPIGGYNTQEGMNNRYRLVWTAGQRGKPGINADIQDAAEATRMIADPDFEILGTNCVSTCSAFNPEGGITLTTTAAAADQVILAPHLDANQSAWTQVTWGTDQQTRWECRIRTGASIVDTIIWAGLKLTNTAVSTTDANEAFFRYEEGVNAGEWQAVYDIANAGPTEVDTNIVVAINTDYHFVIEIAVDRTAKFYIDGVLVATTAALAAVDFIPYIGIEVQAGGAAGAKSIVPRGQIISRNFA